MGSFIYIFYFLVILIHTYIRELQKNSHTYKTPEICLNTLT